MRRHTILAAVVFAAPALAACGGSSSSSTTSPATDQGAAAAVSPTGAGNSTPVDSSAYRKAITTAIGDKGLSPQVAAKVADCVVKRERAQGFKTVADLTRDTAARQQVVQDGAECTVQAMPAG